VTEETSNHETQSTGIPDAAWANRSLPIEAVALALGLVKASGLFHCWHPEKHFHGDETPSVGVWKEKNRIKCFGSACGVGPLSPISLVMDVRGIGVRDALLWLDEHFSIPRIPKRSHLKPDLKPASWYGHETPLELLVRSGVWRELSVPAQRLVPVLLAQKQLDTSTRTASFHLSRHAMMRYSGIGSPNGISRALEELENVHFLTRSISGPAIPPLRPVTSITLTPYSNTFMEYAQAVFGDHRKVVEAEKQLRAEMRAKRTKNPS
jgi:hypothetical protein